MGDERDNELIFFSLGLLLQVQILNLLINFKLQKSVRMSEQISVSLLQPNLIWEGIEANLEKLDDMLTGIPEETDLVLLPETFSTGFTMHSQKFAEGEDGKAVSWMKAMAAKYNLTMAGSLITRVEEGIFNRLFWVNPSGIRGTYDKRHLFRMGREDIHFLAGHQRPVFHLGDFRFLPQICYDLRFPVFSRNRNDYDVLFYVANWPAPRHPVWETLLRARAIENQAYVLGVNRVGTDGEGIGHLGGTCAWDPIGNPIEILNDQEGVLNAELDLNQLRDFRRKFPAWIDADQFRIEGLNG